ncbi:MAG: hypothetical protein IVW51_00370 [Thermaceae bacterium]|nr:hypothetical protein [Thermaceae bacterium]
MSSLRLLALCALLLVTGYGLCASESGIFYAQPGQKVEVRLELRLPPQFALQKRSQFWLISPFAGKLLEAKASGRDWPQDPQHYLQSFDLLVWKLKVPAGTIAGRYPLQFKATVYACDEGLGLCQKHALKAVGSLVVGQQEGTSKLVRLELPRP